MVNGNFNQEISKGHRPGRWFLMLVCSSALLGGCATQRAVDQASGNAHLALQNSQKLNQALAEDRQAQRQQSETLNARFRKLRASQMQLRQQMAMNSMRLAIAEKALRGTPGGSSAGLSPGASGQAASTPDSFMAKLVKRAHASARKRYRALPSVPTVLTKLDFSSYQNLQFRGEVPLWGSVGPLTPSFYPAGYLFHHAVNIYLLNGTQAVPLKFSARDFNFGAAIGKRLQGSVPLAGFSVYYPFEPGHGVNEFISFLGASYFRAVGKGQAWGLSARGLAVNTAEPHQAEEFPYFRDFWIVPPQPGATTLSFYAWLDSPSLVGVYHFVVHPGSQTVVNVKMVLFTRKSVRRLGIAPLTSMFLQGRDGGTVYDPLVRAAHDSDGLSIETIDAQWFWFPLTNPRRLRVESVPEEGIKGFGLMQRSRRYDDYQAWGMDYQKRPSAWVTPTGGDWGRGNIVLVELPTRSQTNDNITAFWQPASPVKAGQKLAFSYRIAWQGDQQSLPPSGHVVSTRCARSGGDQTCVINFRGETRKALPAWVRLRPLLHISGPARLVKSWVAKNRATGNWRLEFTLHSKGDGPVHVLARLVYGKRALTETWDGSMPLE